MVETALDEVVNFLKVKPSHADKHLTQLCAVMADIKHLFKCSARQLIMLDFFKM